MIERRAARSAFFPSQNYPRAEKVTIRLDREVLEWLRRMALDEDASVSAVIARLLENEKSNAYWRAYEEWKRLPQDLGVPIDASKRMTRGEAHERR